LHGRLGLTFDERSREELELQDTEELIGIVVSVTWLLDDMCPTLEICESMRGICFF